MKTTELKEELHHFINEGDDAFVKVLHEMATAYITKNQKDKMIAEGEDDIKHGRVYSLKEARDIMDKWE